MRRPSTLCLLLLSVALSCSSGGANEDADEPAAAAKPVPPPVAAQPKPAAGAAAASAEAPACDPEVEAVSAAELDAAGRAPVGKIVTLRAAYRGQWVSVTGTGQMPSSDRAPATGGCTPGVATVGDDQHRFDITGDVLCSVHLVEAAEYVFTGRFEGPVEFGSPGGGKSKVAATAICKP